MKDTNCTTDCNPYGLSQFTNPQEMFAEFSAAYVIDSLRFCNNLPNYCDLMKNYYEGREYLNGEWINRP